MAQVIGDRGANEIVQPLHDVDANHPVAAQPESGDPIGIGGERRLGRERGAARRGEGQQTLGAGLAAAQAPKLRTERPRARFQQGWHEDVHGSEAHAQLAQGGARALIESFDLLTHPLPLEHAERLRDAIGQGANRLDDGGARLSQRLERTQDLADMRLYPKPETRLDSLAVLGGQRFVGQQDRSRLQQFLARDQPGHGIAEPSNQTVAGQHDGIVHRLGKAGGARGQLLPELRARVWIRV